MGASLVRMGWRPLGLPVPPLSHPVPQKSRRMMAYNNIDFGYHPVGAPTCLHKQVGKPSLNAAQSYAKAEGCVHYDPPRAEELHKGWPFRVGTWNVDSLTSGELVEALAERRMDVACVQETRCRGSGCRFFGAIDKRYKLFWMGSKAKTDGVGIFVAEKWVDIVVSVERHDTIRYEMLF